MLKSLIGFPRAPATCRAPGDGETSALDTIQLSCQISPEDIAAKLSLSPLSIGLPRPSASSLRALHCMAIYLRSERRNATMSMPVSPAVEPGRFASLYGQPPQLQACSMSHSRMSGATRTTRSSSHFPSVPCGLISRISAIAASIIPRSSSVGMSASSSIGIIQA